MRARETITTSATTVTATNVATADRSRQREAERRRSERQEHLTAATLHPAAGDALVAHHTMVCNLSLGGVGFRSPQRFAPGEVWRITLGNGPLFLNARIRIITCRARPDGTYDLGAEFC